MNIFEYMYAIGIQRKIVRYKRNRKELAACVKYSNIIIIIGSWIFKPIIHWPYSCYTYIQEKINSQLYFSLSLALFECKTRMQCVLAFAFSFFFFMYMKLRIYTRTNGSLIKKKCFYTAEVNFRILLHRLLIYVARGWVSFV